LTLSYLNNFKAPLELSGNNYGTIGDIELAGSDNNDDDNDDDGDDDDEDNDNGGSER
jgi:hypothetical protein